jgi:tRNA-2-methylthio-N6-dimethylallyladenosine synthase
LVADTVISVRRTRSGDAWATRQGMPAGEPEPRTVGLGLPTIGVPAPLPDAPACG